MKRWYIAGPLILMTACSPMAKLAPLPTTSTATLVPTTTAIASTIPTPEPPIVAGTAPWTNSPTSLEVITTQNAAHVRQLALLEGDQIEALDWSPDGSVLAVAGSAEVYLYNTQALTVFRTLEGPPWIRSIAFSPDGTLLAAGSLYPSVVWIWKVNTGQKVNVLEGPPDGVRSVAFSPSGEFLAVGSLSGVVQLWNVTEDRLLRALQVGAEVYTVAFSPDEVFAAGMEAGPVRLWDVASGTETCSLEGHIGWIADINFSPDGALLAAAGWDVWIWDVDAGQLIRVLENPSGNMSSVAFSPDGTILASGGGYYDNTVRLWDISTGRELAVLEGHTDWVSGLSFAYNGTLLVSGSADGTLRFWGIRKQQYGKLRETRG